MELQFIWFAVFVVLLTGYAILDGFDLGVGMLHLLSEKDEERRLMLNSIGPVWDGNEVWLVTAGGALFAGFPIVYANLLSGFYIPTMLLLAALIFRAIAIEFRSKNRSPVWRWTWDILFSLASLLIAAILGILLGNLIRGIPLNAEHEYVGTFTDLFHPYALLVAIFAISMFMMHGSIYLMMKTEGELHDRLRHWLVPSIIFFILAYAITSIATLIYMPHMTAGFIESPIFFLVCIVNILAIANIPRSIYFGQDGRAFIMSCLNIVCLMVLYGIGTYPNIVRDLTGPNHLTIWNSSSSEKTLQILLLITAIGVPIVLSYTITIYYIFRGKVKLDTHSY